MFNGFIGDGFVGDLLHKFLPEGKVIDHWSVQKSLKDPEGTIHLFVHTVDPIQELPERMTIYDSEGHLKEVRMHQYLSPFRKAVKSSEKGANAVKSKAMKYHASLNESERKEHNHRLVHVMAELEDAYSPDTDTPCDTHDPFFLSIEGDLDEVVVEVKALYGKIPMYRKMKCLNNREIKIIQRVHPDYI